VIAAGATVAMAQSSAGAATTAQVRGLLQDAYMMTQAIKSDVLRAEVLCDVAATQARAGSAAAPTTFGQAAQVAIHISEPGWRRPALARIGLAQALAGDLAGAIQTAGWEAQSTAELVDGLLERKDVAAARRVADARRGPEGPSLLGRIALAQWKAGDVAGAQRTLQQGLQNASTLPPDWQRSSALESVVTVQAALGDVPGAVRTAESSPHRDRKDYTFGEVALGQALAGDVPGALVTADRIVDRQAKAAALLRAGRARAKAGDTQGALRIVPTIVDEGNRSAVLREVVLAQVRAGDLTAAGATAAGIPNDVHQSRAWRDILRAQLERGDVPGAQQTKTKLSPRDQRLQVEAVREIAVAQARLGDLNAALKTAATIPDDWYVQAWTLHDIAGHQRRKSDVNGALQTASLIKDAQIEYAISADVYREIAAARAASGDVQGAVAWAGKQMQPIVHALTMLGIAEGILDGSGVGPPRIATSGGWFYPTDD